MSKESLNTETQTSKVLEDQKVGRVIRTASNTANKNYVVEIKGRRDDEAFNKTLAPIIAPDDKRAEEWGEKQGKQWGVDKIKVVATHVTDEVLKAMKPEVEEKKGKKDKSTNEKIDESKVPEESDISKKDNYKQKKSKKK